MKLNFKFVINCPDYIAYGNHNVKKGDFVNLWYDGWVSEKPYPVYYVMEDCILIKLPENYELLSEDCPIRGWDYVGNLFDKRYKSIINKNDVGKKFWYFYEYSKADTNALEYELE